MNDTVYRQAVIDALDENKEMINAAFDSLTLDHNTRRNLEQRRGQINEDVETIKELPPAQLEPKWIPVTERLPEEADGTVLVCMPDELPYNRREPFINAKHNQQVEVAMYSQHSDTWFFGMGAVSSTRPIAWMPLPEPYKRSEDAEEVD